MRGEKLAIMLADHGLYRAISRVLRDPARHEEHWPFRIFADDFGLHVVAQRRDPLLLALAAELREAVATLLKAEGERVSVTFGILPVQCNLGTGKISVTIHLDKKRKELDLGRVALEVEVRDTGA